MTLPPLDQVFNTVFPIFTAVIGYVGGQFIPGFTKEFFAKRERVMKHKLEVARHVLRICNEASTGNFHVAPRDMEEVNSTMTNLDGFNEDIGKIMTQFVNGWRELSGNNVRVRTELDHNKYLIEVQQKVEEKRQILISWSNKIRTGK